MSDDPTNPPRPPVPVIPYLRRVPPSGGDWTVNEVVMGLLIGLATVVVGLPVFALWASRHLPASGWPYPLLVYGSTVAALLYGAFTVRRKHQLPGLFPGLAAGIAGGVLVLGAVAFYALVA